MRNFGPCMCGDTQCPSCGPAQGNFRCPYCGAWDDDGGCENPQECEKRAKRDEEAQEQDYLIEEIEVNEARRLGCEYWDLPESFTSSLLTLSLEELRSRKKTLIPWFRYEKENTKWYFEWQRQDFTPEKTPKIGE